MERLVYSMEEVAEMFGYGTDPQELKRAKDWVHDKGYKQCPRGFYPKKAIQDLYERVNEKCISGKEENTTTSRVKYVWANKPLKLKNTVQDLLALKKQESMQTVSQQT